MSTINEAYENYLKGGHIKWLNQVEVDTPIGKINIPLFFKNFGRSLRIFLIFFSPSSPEEQTTFLYQELN